MLIVDDSIKIPMLVEQNAIDIDGPTSPHRSPSATDHAALREKYFAAVVGRSPAPPRGTLPELTPRKGGVAGRRALLTGDAQQDTINANAVAKAQVLQEASTILSVAEAIVSHSTSRVERFPELARRMDEACRAFDEGFKWVLPAGYSLDTVKKDGVLSISGALLEAILQLPLHLPPGELQHVLQGLSGGTKVSRVTLQDMRDQLALLDPHYQCANATTPQQAPSSPAAGTTSVSVVPKHPVSEVIMGMYDYLHMDVQNSILDELKKTDGTKEQLNAQLKQAKRELDGFLDGGQLVEAEECHRFIVTTYAKYVDILAQRAALMQMNNVDAGIFKDQLEALHNEADAVAATFRKDKATSLYDVEKDLERVADARRKQDLKEDTAVKRYEASEGSFQTRMRENEREQMRLLEEMRALAGRIQGLSEGRESMAKAHIAAKEERERDLFQVAEYRGTCDRYTHMLEQLRDYLKTELAVADRIDAYVSTMKRQHLDRPIDDDLTPLRETELGDLYNTYREYVFCSGDLITKKHHRVDVLERQMRFAQHNRGSVKDCLDPNAAKYEADIIELDAKLRQCESLIIALSEQEDATEQLVRQPLADFETIVEKKRGGEFTHPTVEYAEKAVGDRRAFVDKTLRFVEEEERAVERKKAALEAQRVRADEDHQHHLSISANKKAAATTV